MKTTTKVGSAPAQRLDRPAVTRSYAVPAAIAAYVVCALIQYRSVLTRLDSTVMAATDGTLFAWWLRWLPHAIGHWANPFVTHAINAPFGANGMWNTSVPLLALLAAPVTVTAGPVVATNLLFVLGSAASAATAFFVLRRYAHPIAAFVGGLMFGFSPYIATNHLHLMWAFLPALLLVFLDEIFVRQRYSATRLGILFGLACLGQLLVSSEVLASAAVVAAVALAVIVVRGRTRLRTQLPYALHATGVALATFAAAGGWPLYVLLFGPQRVSRHIQPSGRYVSDLVEFVVPGPRQVIAPTRAAQLYSSFSGNISEHSAYLGIPLVVALIAIAVRHRRRPIVHVVAITTLAVVILSLGPRLVVAGVTHEAIPLPWSLIERAPFLKNVLPARLSVFVMMGAAALIAIELSEHLGRGSRRWVPVALLLAALIPLLPVARRPAPLPYTPRFFTRQAHRIPEGSTLVVEPYAHPGNAAAMLWQARAGMRFAMPGGYVIKQAPGRNPDFWPTSTPFRNVSILLEKGEAPRLTEELRTTLLNELHDLGACSVVVGPHPYRPTAVSYFVELLRRSPRYDAGMWVFDLDACGRRVEPWLPPLPI